jgi:hypothetical protein
MGATVVKDAEEDPVVVDVVRNRVVDADLDIVVVVVGVGGGVLSLPTMGQTIEVLALMHVRAKNIRFCLVRQGGQNRLCRTSVHDAQVLAVCSSWNPHC